jgi:hypothetical protein
MGGHMSDVASEGLVKMGYTRVSRLKERNAGLAKKGGQLVHRQSLPN